MLVCRLEQLEMRSAWIAITPFLNAEKDRAKLLRLRENRDVEVSLSSLEGLY